MFVVIVKFKIPDDSNSNDIKKKFQETAPMYQGTDGLIRKNYLLNKDSNIAGGVYIFDTSKNEDSKLSFLESDLMPAIEQHWHLGNLKFCMSFLVANQKSEQAHHIYLSSLSRETRS